MLGICNLCAPTWDIPGRNFFVSPFLNSRRQAPSSRGSSRSADRRGSSREGSTGPSSHGGGQGRATEQGAGGWVGEVRELRPQKHHGQAVDKPVGADRRVEAEEGFLGF